MKVNQLLKLAVWMFIFSAGVLTGCRKDKNDLDTDTGTSVDNAFAEAIYEDASTMADQAVEGGLTSFRGTGDDPTLLSQCATVSLDTVSNPKLITIDFGTTNCLCMDGRYRRGKVLVAYSGAYRDIGTVITIGFDNYFVGDYQVQGTRTVTNQGLNAANHTWFNINVNGTITSPSGQVLSHQSTRVREWIAGENTLLWSDDVYHITGTATGVTFNGTSYIASVTTPLQKALNCRWIENGVLEFTPSGKQTRLINYGYLNGNCDRYAELTIGNNTYTLELR